MADQPYYNIGTATLTVGSTSMVGQGTLWVGNVRPGDVVYPLAGGGPYIVANVVDNTHIELLFPATVAQAAQGYAAMYTPDDPFTQSELRKVLKAISASSLVALSNLVPAARKSIRFDGAANATLIDISDAALALLDDGDASAMLTTLGISAFIKTLLDDPDAATALATLGANNATNLTLGTLPDARVSTTLTSDKAFRRGNILGAVSQSGGVPTGAIIDSGANTDSRYIRFADGTQICTYSPTSDIPFSVAPGAIVTGSALGFLAPFAGPIPFLGLSGYVTDAGGSVLSLAITDGGATTSTQWRIAVANVTSIAVTRIYGLRMFAFGRWF